jgi:hypothetical protein
VTTRSASTRAHEAASRLGPAFAPQPLSTLAQSWRSLEGNVDTVKLVEGGDEPGRVEEDQSPNPEACTRQGRVLARSDQANATCRIRGTGMG